jgi:c(7)-type cytochrome triheme protein
MRFLVAALLAGCLAGCQSKSTPQVETPQVETKAVPSVAPPEPSTSPGVPPDTILITSPYGNVTFTHKKHYERVNSDCSVCHTKIFPQSRAPLNYKKALHRSAEASMTSCAYCHSIGNSAFAADSNCTKCHALREH